MASSEWDFLWVTDFGWGSSEGVVADPNTVDPSFGFVNFTSQTAQAQYIPRAFEVARTLGYVGPMFLYNLNYCQTVTAVPGSSAIVLVAFAEMGGTPVSKSAGKEMKLPPLAR